MQLSADHIGGLHGKGQSLVRGKGGHVGHLQLLPILGHHQHQHDVAGALRGQIRGIVEGLGGAVVQSDISAGLGGLAVHGHGKVGGGGGQSVEIGGSVGGLELLGVQRVSGIDLKDVLGTDGHGIGLGAVDGGDQNGNVLAAGHIGRVGQREDAGELDGQIVPVADLITDLDFHRIAAGRLAAAQHGSGAQCECRSAGDLQEGAAGDLVRHKNCLLIKWQCLFLLWFVYNIFWNGAQPFSAKIQERQREGKFCVIGAGTGASLRPLYAELVRKHKDEGLSFRNVVIFNLYEYYPLASEGAGSSFSQLNDLFLSQIDIDKQNVFTIDGTIPQEAVIEYCRLYEQRIQTFGGIDIVLMGIGREGNIAMNEPGSSLSSPTRLILIDSTSRAEAAHNLGVDNLPPCSITMGVATIMAARKIYLLAWGDDKADIIKKAVEDKVSDTLPASYLQMHNNANVCIDLAAASHLTRIQRPWLVTNCEWNDKLIRSAIVWLCMRVKKPILKLTNKDYNENGLSELLALYGSAYNVNIKIFNDLQHTITGWPGGKPNADDTYRPERAKPFPKRVVVFSPHPDDDVISMGGTLRRLVQQGHEVHVAYETSGNIAVGDEEVVRFMHFINGFNQLFDENSNETIKNKYAEIKKFLAAKKEGDMDSRDILTIKGLIRRGEARTASTYNQIPLNRVHFLDLPFYETGKIEKNPISEADVEIVLQLLRDVKPHQIYVAGDLADPHGTHRVCTDAVLAAIDIEKEAGAEWLKDCRIWMYRGAWAEWEIENIEMAVPFSPEELRAKRNSILKHQSQMESAPFLGNDERLFWQRSEDRNRGTAALYDQLGLACYEAMEAFVEYVPL